MDRNNGHRPSLNTPFISAARQLANQVQQSRPSRIEAQQMKLGRAWAVELIDALRGGDVTPNLLMAGVTLSGKNQDACLMAGFLDELSQAIAEGVR